LLIRSRTLNLGMLPSGQQIAHQSSVCVLRSRWFDHRSRGSANRKLGHPGISFFLFLLTGTLAIEA
jgi:hypothetical protein